MTPWAADRVGRLEVFNGYKEGKPVHEIEGCRMTHTKTQTPKTYTFCVCAHKHPQAGLHTAQCGSL